jgi:hypothetical protein
MIIKDKHVLIVYYLLDEPLAALINSSARHPVIVLMILKALSAADDYISKMGSIYVASARGLPKTPPARA